MEKLVSTFLNKRQVAIILLLIVYLLAIAQDYFYSIFQNTGFYITESLLYNTYWIFFIPFSFILDYFIEKIDQSSLIIRASLALGLGLLSSILHILLFTTFFIFISHLFFEPPHYFSSIFTAALSNQFYITVFFYVIAPTAYYHYKRSKINLGEPNKTFNDTINIKHDSKIITLKSSLIELITTEKPYSVIQTNDQKYYLDKNLKNFENELDPNTFIRVHKSIIVNKSFILELNSRKNGDYDALLKNGQTIRFSRHLRENWKSLLH